MGGKFHLKLNNGERPIANKYRERKMKSTLKRESKVLEIAKREAMATSEWIRPASASAPVVVAHSCDNALCVAARGWWALQLVGRVKIHSNGGRRATER